MKKLKQAILRAIAIKLEVETHKKYRKVMTKLAWFIFVAFLGYGLYNSVGRYNHSSAILNDVSYVEAEVEELPDYISETQSSYRYKFTVGGNEYQQDFVASHKNYESYLGDNGVKIAYQNSDPSKYGIADVVQKNGSVSSIFKHFAIMFFLGGFGFLALYIFLTNGIVQPKEQYEDEDENEEAKQARQS